MVQALDASLKRLRTDYIDVYWLHVWDAFTPVEEVVRTLDDAVRAGKVLYVGISDTPARLVSQAVVLADLRGWTRFAGLPVPYSLVERAAERDLLPMAHALELAVTTWEPLGGGLLTGRYGTDLEPPPDSRIATTQYGQRVTERNLAIADALNRVADEHGDPGPGRDRLGASPAARRSDHPDPRRAQAGADRGRPPSVHSRSS
jgi:aryl-alcohol dehydrogenase-like predicted oxidoreductase